MANFDVSLDDIIRRKNKNPTGVFGFQNRRKEGRVAPGRTFDLKSKLQNRRLADARLKIVGRHQAKVQDARDRLNHLAKRTDARQRLQKLRAVKQRQGRPAMTTKTPFSVTRTVANPRLRRENQKPNEDTYTVGGFERRSKFSMAVDKTGKRFLTSGAGFRKTISSSFVGRRPTMQDRTRAVNVGDSLLRTFSIDARERSSRERRFLAATDDELNDKTFDDSDDEENAMDFVANQRSKTLNTGDENLSLTFPSHLSASLKSRLSPMDSASPLQGYKVVVSNLHADVSRDDIQELFGEIGPLRKANLDRRGLAEVVFYELSHALKACEAYHNRQLDGKPMCVKLVTAFDAAGSTARSSDDHLEGPSGSRKISPDVDIIRRALFHKGTPGTAPQQPLFTITMTKK